VLSLAVLALCLALVAARAPLYNLESKTVVPNTYMVVFHKDSTVQIRDNHVKELVNRFHVAEFEKVTNTFAIGDLIGYSAILSKETLEQELEHPNVRYIEADQYVHALVDPYLTQNPATWGIDRIDQTAIPLNNTYHYFQSAGAGVTAYIIDTGVYVAHNEFTGRATFGANFAGGVNDDCNGHGTHVAGTIAGTLYGLAKKATIIGVKVLDCSGSGQWTWVISGINWVTNHHNTGTGKRSVANMSLGGGATPTVDEAVKNSHIAGVTHVVAAGNSGTDACTFSPARAPEAITVGATDSSDVLAYFSNVGSCVDVLAPGVSITGPWIGSNTATNIISGTSMASPHVAGAVAVYLGHLAHENQGIPTPDAVAEHIIETSTKEVLKNLPSNTKNRLLYSNWEEVDK